MSAPSGSWRAAHGARWYDDARYRFAWLMLPQACAALLVLAAVPLLRQADKWGEPASSKELEKRFADLLDKAGKDGDKAAFDEMTKAADAGGIAANSILAHLYDPGDAGAYPKNPVQPDAAKALKMYRVAADAGFPGGQRGATVLTLNQSYPTYDLKQGCRYGTAFYANPLAIQVKHFEEWSTLALIANCYVDEGSGVKRDLPKAASIYLDGVAAKHKPTIALLSDKLGLQPKDLVTALQQNLKQRGLYYGALDGAATAQTIGAIRSLAGEASKPPPPTNPPPANPPPANPPPANPPSQQPPSESAQVLFEKAKSDRTSEIRLRFLADGGDTTAQLLYGMLFAPAYTAQRTTVLDARRAMTYFELLSKRGDAVAGAAAAWGAMLYDAGYPELPRDGNKAAFFAVRALELKNADMVKMLESNKWGPGFWSTLQAELTIRNLYTGMLVDRRNDRSIMAARRLAEGRP